jgi:predicted component of type VI protein secretion system
MHKLKTAQLDMHQCVRIIQQGAVSGQIIAFRAANTLSFPFSDIAGFVNHGDREFIELTCLGLQGVSSPLPHYFVTDALDEDNRSLREFLGIFNQQIYHAYFKAWQSKHPHLFHESCFQGHEILASLGADNLNPRNPVPRLNILFLYAQRSIHELQELVKTLFPEIPHQITVRQSEWIETQTPAQLGTGSARLNDNLTLGKRIPIHAHRIMIELGPLTLQQAQAAQSHDWITRYLNRMLQIEFRWRIAAQAGQRRLDASMRLGWNATLGNTTKDLIKVQHAH